MMNNQPNEILRAFEPVTPKNSGLSESSLALIRQTLAPFPSVRRALLLGSRAKGNFYTGSDVDIALEGSSTLTVMDIAAELNERLPLPYFFDIVSLDELDSMPLREHIFRVGRVLFRRNNHHEDSQ